MNKFVIPLLAAAIVMPSSALRATHQERLTRLLNRSAQSEVLQRRVQRAQTKKELKAIAQQARVEQHKTTVSVIQARYDKIDAYLKSLASQGKNVSAGDALLVQAKTKIATLNSLAGKDYRAQVREIYQLFRAIAKTLK